MRERPGSFFFCAIGHMVQETLPIAATPHYQRKADQSPKGHEGPLGMIGYPEPLPTTDALLAQRREAHFPLGRGTRSPSPCPTESAPLCGNYSATFLRKRFRLSLSVERT